jgi:plasmid stabilization system protein ParE
MSYQVFFTNFAVKDLRGIRSYVEQQHGVNTARRVYIEIRDSIRRLEAFPNLGKPMPQLAKIGYNNYRHLLVGEKSNRVIYEIDETNKAVFIHLVCTTDQHFNTTLTKRLLEM